jgi:phosphatidylglycerophosphatase A
LKFLNIKFYIKILSTVFFIGFCPFAPGTAGSLAGLLLYILLLCLSLPLRLSLILLTIIIGGWCAAYYEKFTGRKDPPEIVIDEVVGIWTAYLFLPLNLWIIIAGFVFYRAMDILKIFPIKRLENLRGGIMLDDIMAGIYTNIFLRCLFWGIN